MSREKPKLNRRGTGWEVDFGQVERPDGRRVRERRLFRTRAEAQEAIAVRGFESKNRMVRLQKLTDDQRTDVLRALRLLEADSATLEQAVRFYLKHGRPVSGPLPLPNLASEYIASKEAAGRRPATIRDARIKVDRFVKGVGKKHTHEVMTMDVENWLHGQGFTPATWDSYRRAVVGLFNYAVKRKYVAENPALPIEAVEFDQAIPEVMDVADVRKLLNTAARQYPTIVPHFAIGFFCGLRKAELEGLDWHHVDLQECIVTVTPATAKKRRMRHVDIPQNALAWLTPHWKPDGPVPYSRRHFRAVREAADVQWADNVMRHSFASYHLAHHQDPAKTSLQLGHQRPDVLFSNYRNIRTMKGANVTAKTSKHYWSIRPRKDADNVIPLATGS